MGEELEILELYELRYSDLILLSSNHVSSSSSSSEAEAGDEETKRLESISKAVLETLGPSGPGLLSITGVPNVSDLRRTLLPLARNLALLNHDDRKRVLKKHELGSDVSLKNMDRIVSSFAMQLKYVHGLNLGQNGVIHEDNDNHKLKQDLSDIHRLGDMQHDEFKDLGNTFKELGSCMIELGLRLARICDRAIGGQELEQSLLESGTAKGRLIHYHSSLDNIILKESGRRKRSSKGLTKFKKDEEPLERKLAEGSNINTSENEANYCQSALQLWQQWHYDYGIFTVLTDPLFIFPCHLQTTKAKDDCFLSFEQEFPSTSGNTYLQIFDPNKNKVLMVKSSPENFIIQVGESADILSKGKLRSTLHSVCRPENLGSVGRETFVVFLQPAWSKSFSVSDYPMKPLILGGQSSEMYNEDTLLAEEKMSKVTQEIQKIIPPLSSRLKDGMTFAEFSRETTKQYYGGSGLQSKR